MKLLIPTYEVSFAMRTLFHISMNQNSMLLEEPSFVNILAIIFGTCNINGTYNYREISTRVGSSCWKIMFFDLLTIRRASINIAEPFTMLLFRQAEAKSQEMREERLLSSMK